MAVVNDVHHGSFASEGLQVCRDRRQAHRCFTGSHPLLHPHEMISYHILCGSFHIAGTSTLLVNSLLFPVAEQKSLSTLV